MRFWPVAVNVALRALLCAPLGLLAGVLCITIIGMPVAAAIFVLVGSWVTKPIRRHPMFNVEGDAE
jgi:hypothetical protein